MGFFGEQTYEGYKMFLEEITNSIRYPDVYIVPINAGIEYMKNPVPNIVLLDWGKETSIRLAVNRLKLDLENMLEANVEGLRLASLMFICLMKGLLANDT